jgi:DNA modification methylase|tara:strand:- start:3803 stop:4792 length:990 start_codon:yes stop_codon:yes gene_type:complete
MNKIELGDSRELLKQLEKLSVDAVYFDPPFNSNRKYRLTSSDDSIGFDDIFKSDDEYVKLVEPMVKECARVLKKDGSFFFHISADQMLIPQMICSKFFSRVQPIFWKRSRSKNNVKTKLGACTDVIFWCSHVAKPKFNMVYQPLDSYYAENSYKNKDARGNYALGHVCYTRTQAPDKSKSDRYYSIVHKGKTYSPTYGWRMSLDDLEALIKDGRIHFPKNKKNANPYKKIYAHESKGKPSTDYWDDLHSIAMGSEERVYPTQKPVSLMRRIIEMSTNVGDVILDPVAGAGTTGVAASQLGRNYILFDISEDAIEACERRIKNEGKNLTT